MDDIPCPCDREAEEKILGALITDRKTASLVFEEINEVDFYYPENAKLFNLLYELHFNGTSIDDSLVIKNEIKKKDLVEKVGGLERIESLEMKSTPWSVGEHCQIIKDRAAERLAIDQALNLLKAVREGRGAEIYNGKKVKDDWPDIVDAGNKIRTNPEKRPDELIENVCFVGSKISLSAPSKARKTFIQMHLGACIATGHPWLGCKVKKGPVLYLNLELIPYSFEDRLDAIKNKLGVSIDDGMFDVWHLRGQKVTIEKLEERIKAKVERKKYQMIYYDPLYKLLGTRGESNPEQMADLFNRLESMAYNAGSAYLVAHHFTKGNAAAKEAIDRSSGSGVVARDGDVILTLTPHEESDSFSMEATLRDFAPLPARVVTWEYPIFRVNEELDPEKLKQAKQNTRNVFEPITDDLVLQAVGTKRQIREVIVSELMKLSERGEKYCSTALTCAVEKGIIKSKSYPPGPQGGKGRVLYYNEKTVKDE